MAFLGEAEQRKQTVGEKLEEDVSWEEGSEVEVNDI